MALAVCGAHLAGLPLNGQLLARGGRLLQETHSAPRYRLYALADGKRPAMVRDERDGAAIAVEVWEIPSTEVGSLLAAIPAPLGLGQVELADGRWVTGFICEAAGLGRPRKSLPGAAGVSGLPGKRNILCGSAAEGTLAYSGLFSSSRVMLQTRACVSSMR
ncbi:allophanate hydrolase [Klebsiella aerogenes]|nr:allophanate hydrolase [Klebsiella aerogenes]